MSDAHPRALAHLEEFLERAHPGFADDTRLHAQARALSASYTDGAGERRSDDDDAAASIAYLAHFGPRAIASLSYALAAGGVEHAPKVCVDAGAGSGASALALAFAGARRLVLVEKSAAALATAKKLLAGLRVDGAAIDVELRAGDLERAAPVAGAGLAISAFTFGELAGEPRAGFASIERIAPSASRFVLVDAGDRPRARRLQELRDRLVLDEKRGVIAPCPHRDACPALVRERDWCHTRIAKELPAKLARFARGVGRDDEAMALMYLVVGKRDENHGATRDDVLALGEPLKEKGRARLPVCGPAGLRFVQALKRDRAAHDALLHIERGARFAVPSGERNAGGDTISVDDAESLRSTT